MALTRGQRAYTVTRVEIKRSKADAARGTWTIYRVTSNGLMATRSARILLAGLPSLEVAEERVYEVSRGHPIRVNWRIGEAEY